MLFLLLVEFLQEKNWHFFLLPELRTDIKITVLPWILWLFYRGIIIFIFNWNKLKKWIMKKNGTIQNLQYAVLLIFNLIIGLFNVSYLANLIDKCTKESCLSISSKLTKCSKVMWFGRGMVSSFPTARTSGKKWLGAPGRWSWRIYFWRTLVRSTLAGSSPEPGRRSRLPKLSSRVSCIL